MTPRKYFRAKSGIYLVKDPSGPIKLGITGLTPEYRMRGIQGGNPRPLTLLACKDGDHRHEKILQEVLKDYHIHHEWFHPPQGKALNVLLQFFDLEHL